MKEKWSQKDEGIKIITYCFIGNLALLLLKGSVGLLAGSQALTADAVNSAGDVMSSLVVLLGLRYALKPHDEDHHYGHGKMEALVSLFVGIFILISIGFLASNIVATLSQNEIADPSYIALIAAFVSVIVKSVMYKKTSTAGKSLNSIAIMTSAKDHKNDIFATSGAVVAISLALVGQRFGVGFLLKYSEPVMAAVIGLFIIKTAIEIIIEASKMLLDAAPDKKTVSDLKSIIGNVDDVLHLNWVKCRKMGRGLLVDAAVEVNRHKSVLDGHAIGDEVKFAIMAKYPEVIDVVVHVNPCTCQTENECCGI